MGTLLLSFPGFFVVVVVLFFIFFYLFIYLFYYFIFLFFKFLVTSNILFYLKTNVDLKAAASDLMDKSTKEQML